MNRGGGRPCSLAMAGCQEAVSRRQRTRDCSGCSGILTARARADANPCVSDQSVHRRRPTQTDTDQRVHYSLTGHARGSHRVGASCQRIKQRQRARFHEHRPRPSTLQPPSCLLTKVLACARPFNTKSPYPAKENSSCTVSATARTARREAAHHSRQTSFCLPR